MNLQRLLSSDTSSPLSKVIQSLHHHQRAPSLASVLSVDQVSTQFSFSTQAQSTCRPLRLISSSSVQSSDPAPPAHVDPHVIPFLKKHLGDAKWRVFSSRLCDRRSINPAQVGKPLCGGNEGENNSNGDGNGNLKTNKKD